jgi:hypothetical protein
MELEKIKPTTFRGIDFIQIIEIPDDQRQDFISWLTQDQIITVATNKKVYSRCVQYSLYNEWYNRIKNPY